MEEFMLNEDEYYALRCGEIYLTTMGRFFFHCTLCEKIFHGFNGYKLHVNKHVAKETKEKESNGCSEDETDLNEDKHEVELYEDSSTRILRDLESYSISNESRTSNSVDREKSPTEYYKNLRLEKDCSFPENDMDYGKKEKVNRLVEVNSEEIIKGLNEERTHAVPLVTETDGEYILPDCTLKKMARKPKPKVKNLSDIKLRRKRNSKRISNNDSKLLTIDIEAVREVEKRAFPRSQLIPEESRKYKCPVCNLGFKERHNMEYHLKRHSNNKDHKCSICGKSFYTTSEVTVHMRVHTKERPFLCNICGKSYVYSTHLSAHLRIHAPVKNYKCEICDKEFYEKAKLTAHMVGHSLARPFSCETCSASFPRKRSLMNHKKLHENKREYQCHLCSFGFNQRAGLFSHMKTAHKMELS